MISSIVSRPLITRGVNNTKHPIKQHQMAIVRLFAVHLTGTGRQQVLKVRKQCSIQLRRFHARMSRGELMAVSRHIK